MILPVTDDGTRPADSPDKCFYCGSVKGYHKEDCVCRLRTVVLEMTIRYVDTVPASWDERMIEFHRNESSSCSSNSVRTVAAQVDAGPCPCDRTEIKYIGEATEEDMEHMGFNAAEAVEQS